MNSFEPAVLLILARCLCVAVAMHVSLRVCLPPSGLRDIKTNLLQAACQLGSVRVFSRRLFSACVAAAVMFHMTKGSVAYERRRRAFRTPQMAFPHFCTCFRSPFS